LILFANSRLRMCSLGFRRQQTHAANSTWQGEIDRWSQMEALGRAGATAKRQTARTFACGKSLFTILVNNILQLNYPSSSCLKRDR
jgi:hypothetical protein